MPTGESEQVAYLGGAVRLKLAQNKFVVRVPRDLVVDGRGKEMTVDRKFSGPEDMKMSYEGCLGKTEATIKKN